MIDPAKILEAIQSAQQLGANATSSMSKPFMENAATGNIQSGENASQINDGVTQASRAMLQNMEGMRESILNQLGAIQDKQRREKTYDFKPSMDDLRPTDAQGWPSELSGEFFKPFFGR